MKKISNVELRCIIAEEYSWMIGKLVGMRPCGDDQSPAVYYANLPEEMKVYVDQCVDRIAVRMTGQSPKTLDGLQ